MLQPVEVAPAPEETPYDAVAYPTAIFAQSTPDRMALLARLNGLDPPSIETARVLEIAGGDGMNLIALAQAWPRASFTSFDLAATAVARGRAWIAGAGLSNVRVEALDILDAAARLEGQYDYIVAHGIYAWVPPAVRAALMTLIGTKLAPRGVAMVSYNALPGGYIRLALRDTLLFALDGIDGAEQRMMSARRMLEELADAEGGASTPFVAAQRHAAAMALRQGPNVLFHDELGDSYHPQALVDVVHAAQGNGLRYLADSGPALMEQGFLPDTMAFGPDVERDIVRLRQMEDYRSGCFFHHTLLVRDSARPLRRLDRDALAGAYAATRAERMDADSFRIGTAEFEISDATLAEAIDRLIAVWPDRVRVGDLVAGDAQRGALFELFNAGHVELHTTPPPHAVTLAAAPCVSPLARTMFDDTASQLCALDHSLARVEALPRPLVSRLDGSLSGAALAMAGREAGLDTPEALDDALRRLLRSAILLP